MPDRPAHSPDPTRSAALTAALARCAAGEGDALRLSRPAAPAVAAAWLQDAAERGDGLVWRPRDGDIWLLGANRAATDRVRDALSALGMPPETPDLPAMQALLDTTGAAPPAQTMPATGLEARAAIAQPRIAAIWRMGAAGPDVLAQRWWADPALVFDGLEPDIRRHAATLLAARVMALAVRGAWPAQHKAALPLLLDLPPTADPAALPRAPDGTGHALVLPLELAPQAESWRAAAALAGWDLAWDGMAPALAPLLPKLPGQWVFAPWDAALPATPWAAPERLVATGLPNQAALAALVRARLAAMSVLPA